MSVGLFVECRHLLKNNLKLLYTYPSDRKQSPELSTTLTTNYYMCDNFHTYVVYTYQSAMAYGPVCIL